MTLGRHSVSARTDAVQDQSPIKNLAGRVRAARTIHHAHMHAYGASLKQVRQCQQKTCRVATPRPSVVCPVAVSLARYAQVCVILSAYTPLISKVGQRERQRD
jgi:hypothetical protein